jgi:hypothetical protein
VGFCAAGFLPGYPAMSTPEREHIAGRVAALIDDVAMREKVEALKKVAHASVREGGSSHNNFDRFVAAMKA